MSAGTPKPVAFEPQGPWCVGFCKVPALSDIAIVEQFEFDCADCLKQQKPRYLAMDMTGVNCMVTRALTTLLMLHKRQREAGNYLAVCGLDSNVMRVLRLTRLDRVFDIYPDLKTLLALRPEGHPAAAPAPGFGP